MMSRSTRCATGWSRSIVRGPTSAGIRGPRPRSGRASPRGAGRSSIVWNRDGRRFYLARANAPQIEQPTATLSAREEQVARAASFGHSNKLIASSSASRCRRSPRT